NTAKPQAVNTARPKAVKTARPNSTVVNVVRVNQANAIKASACWVWRPTKPDSASITLKKHNYIDAQGISKSVISKSLIEDMLPLVKESEEERSLVKMCDKKNRVLFTDIACFVLSPDFKLPDESQILLKIPRKNNMYSVDMKNIVPKECLTCLFAKATLNESMLWHRRLGHISFKTINKLVKDNLVRGLPSKHFENDQTCVACLKGKQHKASSSKDETSGILKSFITEIENLVDKKVKIIRCDNGTEFKNRVMSEFCEKKGIKREFSIARTPQQNSVAERRNRTLIEADRTIDAEKKDDEGVNKESGIDDQERPGNNTQDVNTVRPSINTASTNVNTGSLNINIISPTVTTAPLEATHADFFVEPKKKVWTLVDLPYGKRAIGTKWVYRNKKDERDDIIFGSTRNEMCTEFEKIMHKKFQMSSMGELTFFLGMQVTHKDDGIFISQDKYVNEILKKFGFSTVKTSSTPMETSKPLLKDAEAEDVDVDLYRSMIGSLMYLTASRPDIMFAVYACARLQVTPKVSHLHAVKRIFRYPKDSPFELEAYTDSDYAGASLDRKSTTGANETVIKEWEDRMERAATTASSLEAEQDSGAKIPHWGGAEAQIRFETASKQSNDPPLSRVNTLGSGEDSMKLKELMDLCTKLPEKVLDLG
ncbi:putative ribonuclease H-like domain-containing protein, partial [Tanacetum coccineum]